MEREKGLGAGLVDRIGILQDAIDCAARMAKTTITLKEYPEPKSLLDMMLGDYKGTMQHEGHERRNGRGRLSYL